MKKSLRMREKQQRLLIQVEYDVPLWERLFQAITGGLAIGLGSKQIFHFRLWWMLSIITASAIYLAAVGRKRAELAMSRSEFRMRRNFGKQPRTDSILMRDVRWLEFQPASKDGEFELGGMHAVTTHGHTCLLPLLNEQEVSEVIVEIEKRFPELAERWRAESPFTDHFLTLGLTKKT